MPKVVDIDAQVITPDHVTMDQLDEELAFFFSTKGWDEQFLVSTEVDTFEIEGDEDEEDIVGGHG
jgi:hypothetical protein